MVRGGCKCVFFVIFGHILEDLGQIICHIDYYLELHPVVQSHSKVLVYLPSVDFQVCLISVSFSKLVDNLFGRAVFYMGFLGRQHTTLQ